MYLKPSRAISTHLDLSGVCIFLPAPSGNQPLVAPACRAKAERRRESHRRRTCRTVVRRKGWEFFGVAAWEIGEMRGERVWSLGKNPNASELAFSRWHLAFF